MQKLKKEMAEFQKLDMKTKLNLFDLLYENMHAHDDQENMSNEISKRNNRNSERKRPGWELAYGKRKRSIN
jgi:hypothetical protein